MVVRVGGGDFGRGMAVWVMGVVGLGQGAVVRVEGCDKVRPG